MNETRERVRAFIIEHFLFGQGNDLKDGASFLEQGIIDSTGVLELVTFLEQTFSIRIDADETLPENLDSIDVICTFVETKRQAAAKA